ncbi:TAFII55 protein conserved region, partial [Trinorchestia longiramus]
MNRSLKRRITRAPGLQGPELENHFILRVPQPQAEMLRELLRSNQSSNIKDQLSIQLDHSADSNDMRNGVITVDTMMYKARLVDLPTVVESWKTIDNKNFYKTADICQILELPEIEKEVKRLLRADEEALNVKWEVLREDEEKLPSAGGSGDVGGLTKEGLHQQERRGGAGAAAARDNAPTNLDEQLFGEMLSSSEDEVGPTINIMDEDEDSRFSVEDSRLSEQFMEATSSPLTSQMGGAPYGGESSHPLPLTSYPGHLPLPPVATNISQAYPTEFNPSMFGGDGTGNSSQFQSNDEPSYQELSNVGT